MVVLSMWPFTVAWWSHLSDMHVMKPSAHLRWVYISFSACPVVIANETIHNNVELTNHVQNCTSGFVYLTFFVYFIPTELQLEIHLPTGYLIGLIYMTAKVLGAGATMRGFIQNCNRPRITPGCWLIYDPHMLCVGCEVPQFQYYNLMSDCSVQCTNETGNPDTTVPGLVHLDLSLKFSDYHTYTEQHCNVWTPLNVRMYVEGHGKSVVAWLVCGVHVISGYCLQQMK